MTRTEALRKLYKKVTNEEAPVTANTITEVLVALADKYSGDEPVAANTITDALVALADNYSGGGGGGSSDFSTAQVTVTVTDGYLHIPTVISTPIDAILDRQVNTMSGEVSLIVPLYKGSLALSANVGASVNVTGDIQDMGRGGILITGDGTITINSEGGSGGGGTQ